MPPDPTPIHRPSAQKETLSPSRRYRHRWDIAMLVGLAVFSGWVTTGHFLATHSLYHDNHKFYGLFRDQLHAANTFGEWALWFPHYQGGWPGYYYNFLGDLNCSSPVFVLHQAIFWLAGRLGIIYDNFFVPYVLYYGFEVPLLYIVATYCLARQLFRDRRVVSYVCILSAFSPGVLFNCSDVGFLEPLAYGLFFLTSFIAWFRQPTSRGWVILALATCVLATSLNFTFLIWNVTFLPVAVLAFIASMPQGFQRFFALLRQWFRWFVVLIGSAALCAAPNVLVLSQGNDMVRSHIGDTRYAIDDMSVGSPIEPLSASIPGVGMAWKDKVFQLTKPDQVAAAYTYLGFACWPFALVFLMRGPVRARIVAVSMMILFFGIVILGPASPFWKALLTLVPPLRANNHFSDITYRGGGFIIPLFTAAAGLGLLNSRGGVRHRTFAVRCLAGMAVCSLAAYAALSGTGVLGYPALGFMLLMALAFGVVLMLSPTGSRWNRWSGYATSGLLALVLVDVATNASFHVRAIFIGKGTAVRDEVLPAKVGFVSTPEEYANHLVCDRRFLELAKMGFDPRQLPAVVVFTRAHVEQSPKEEIAAFVAAAKDNRIPSLGIDASAADSKPFSSFIATDASSVTDVRVERRSMTYNTVSYAIEAPRDTLCYINDAYSPYWKASIDGRPTPIARALVRGKAVVMPAGRHVLDLAFRPPYVLWSLACSYGVLLTYAYLVIRLLCVDRWSWKSRGNR